MSTPPAPLSPNSRVYTSPSQPAEHLSFLSSSPLSHTTSRTPDSPDSLRSASPSEVEARALDFLHEPGSVNPSLPINPHSLPSLREIGAVDPSELPRKVPSTDAGRKEGQDAAVEFLRRCLEGAEETSWMYHTPAPFDQPQPLSHKTAQGTHRAALTDDGLPSRDEAWAERAFNLAAYADPTAGMSSHVSEMDQQQANGGEGEGEWADDDGEPGEGDDTFDTGRTAGREPTSTAQRRVASGRTGALVRGVSGLAMNS